MQLTFQLTQRVDYVQAIANVDNPDRATAEESLESIRREYGPRLVKAAVHKIKNRRGSPTWTVRYVIRKTKTVSLFGASDRTRP